VAKRNYIIQIIKGNSKFGFQPIETPSFENSDTLMGKYGRRSFDFKILNSELFGESQPTHLENKDSTKLTASISEKHCVTI
jgi:histidyl-tRNA synthetase